MLSHIHANIIDKRFSEYDEKKSDPKKGKYVWLKETKYRDSLKDKSRLPEHWISWGRKTEEGWDLMDQTTRLTFTFVELNDPYFPPGAQLDENDHWVYKDAIMMKCPLRDYIERRKHDIEASESAVSAKRREFMSTAVTQEGESVGLSKDDLRNLGILGQFPPLLCCFFHWISM